MRLPVATGFLLCALAAGADESLAPPWRSIAPGVEMASAADLGGDPSWAARVLLIDPAHARFAVRFDAGKPTLAEWRERYPQALAISVGSFFSDDHGKVRPTCDVISEGRAIKGAGCQRQDALFFGAHPSRAHASVAQQKIAAVAAASHSQRGRPPERKQPPARAGPGLPQPRLLTTSEFRPDEWSESLKSFPALVHAGYPACVGHHYCTEVSRTAAIAQLRDGRLLLFASQWPAVRREVARFLAEILGAEEALNLDGGPEATLALRGEDAQEAVGNPAVGLPFVLLLLPAD